MTIFPFRSRANYKVLNTGPPEPTTFKWSRHAYYNNIKGPKGNKPEGLKGHKPMTV